MTTGVDTALLDLLSTEHYVLFLKYFLQVQVPVYIPIMPTIERTLAVQEQMQDVPQIRDIVTLSEKEITMKRRAMVELHQAFLTGEFPPEEKKTKLEELCALYVSYQRFLAPQKEFATMELEDDYGFIKTGPFIWKDINSGTFVSDHYVKQEVDPRLNERSALSSSSLSSWNLRSIDSYSQPQSLYSQWHSLPQPSQPSRPKMGSQWTLTVPVQLPPDHAAKVMSGHSKDLELYFVQHNIVAFYLRLLVDELILLPQTHKNSAVLELLSQITTIQDINTKLESVLVLLNTLNVPHLASSLTYYIKLLPLLCQLCIRLTSSDLDIDHLMEIYGTLSKFPKTIDPDSMKGLKLIRPVGSLPKAIMYLIQAYMFYTTSPKLIQLYKTKKIPLSEWLDVDKKYLVSYFSLIKCHAIWKECLNIEEDSSTLRITLSFLFDKALAKKWTGATDKSLLNSFLKQFTPLVDKMASAIYHIYHQTLDKKVLEQTTSDLLLPLTVTTLNEVDLVVSKLQHVFASWTPPLPKELREQLLQTVVVYYQ